MRIISVVPPRPPANSAARPARHGGRNQGRESMWPDRRAIDLLGVDLPIIQAPMAGPVFSPLVVAVAEAGGLGSLPCATMGTEQVRGELKAIRTQTAKPLNVNFFCHTPPSFDAVREERWRARLKPYYDEFGLALDAPASNRSPFDEAACALV